MVKRGGVAGATGGCRQRESTGKSPKGTFFGVEVCIRYGPPWFVAVRLPGDYQIHVCANDTPLGHPFGRY